MATGSSPAADAAGAAAEALHRLRSALARLRGELELLELDGRAPGAEAFAALENALACLDRVEAEVLIVPGRVWVLDDDQRLAELTATRLARVGFSVSCAADVVSVLPQIGPNDRLVLDYGLLPDPLDAEVASMIRSVGTVVVSGSASPTSRSRALVAGALAYLLKPVDLGELATLLRLPAEGRR